MKSVTVVVPVFNSEKHIKKCINSILKQTYTGWKLILVDDGSKDGSGIICDRYAQKDNRIRVIHQANQGSVSARRNGVMAVETEYCCFLDADDVLPANAIDLMISSIPNSNESFVVIGQTVRMFRSLAFKSNYCAPCFSGNKKTEYSHNEFIDQLYCSWFGITNVPVSLWAKVYPSKMLKDTFGNVPKIVKFMGDDLIITLDVMPKVDNTVIIPDVVYQYRVGGGTTKYQPEMMNDWLNLYRFKKIYAERYPMPQNIQKLMDYELINMTFSYFSMLEHFNKLTNAIITDVCEIKEIFGAANNPDIKPTFLKAKAVREKDISQIRQILQKSFKQKCFDIIKKALYRLA